MLSKLESILMPLAERIGKNKYLIAIRDGFLLPTSPSRPTPRSPLWQCWQSLESAIPFPSR